MRSIIRISTLLIAVAALACGPSSGGGGDDDMSGSDGGGPPGCQGPQCLNYCPTGTMTTISGIVKMPNGVDPVPGAIVYVPTEVTEFPSGVRCEICDTITDAALVSTTTAVDGSFTLGPIPTHENAQPGFTVQLVAQKGRFRKLVELQVQNPCESNTLDPSAMQLPGATSGYDTIPNIAVATGDYDVMECVLLKLGLEQGSFDLYHGLTLGSTAGAAGNLDALLQDLSRMKQYHIIFLNCANDTYEQLLSDPTIRANIEDYVLSGGRLYVTDWSYDYIEQVEEFAPIIDFAPDPSGPEPEAPNAAAVGTGGITTEGLVHDTGLADWLRAVEAVTGSEIIDDQGRVHIEHFSANWVMQLMVNESDTVKVWLSGDVSGGGLSGVHPLTTTFDYAQCGRVLYSSYHTAGREGLGIEQFPDYCASGELSPQERVLEYLILHVADCIVVD
jgi:hypothetical protein